MNQIEIDNNELLVTILMSTYNGEHSLEKQIDSILNQSHQNFKLIIRDDKSVDSTISIVKGYQKKFPNKIFLLEDEIGNIGSTKSFFQLLASLSNDAYIMFSDQDDYWFKNKITIFLSRMVELEKVYKDKHPLLVFGDMIVTDNDSNIINESFWNYQKINPNIIFNWKETLSQNVVTGCSMMLNKKAAGLFKNIPEIRMIHDHFIAIKIAKYGKATYIIEPTMNYVQHNRNVVGASSFDLKYILKKIKKINISWIEYYKLCQYFEMNFLFFLFFKFKTNIQRVFFKF